MTELVIPSQSENVNTASSTLKVLGHFDVTCSNSVSVYEDPDTPEVTRFLSAYDGIGTFSADIRYYEKLTSNPEDPVVYKEIEVESYDAPFQGFTTTQVDSTTIRISGTATNVIAGSLGQFTYLMPDKSIQILPANTTEEYDAVVAWSPPTVRMQVKTHTLNVKVKNGVVIPTYNAILVATQEIYWYRQFGISAFQLALSKGKL